MAHLKSELRECCKKCIYLGYYDDRQSSWYYCGYLGDAYSSAANKNVDAVVKTVFEKRDGDIIPRFYPIESCKFCTRSVDAEKLINVVQKNIFGNYKDALLYILKNKV